MTKRRKLPKRAKGARAPLERPVHRNRLRPARAWRLNLGQGCHVELRVAQDKRRMHEAQRYCDGDKAAGAFDRRCAGLCRYWYCSCTREERALAKMPGRIVARIYLNARDLRAHPSEYVAHECAHAAMAWARYRKADVYTPGMAGEEVLAYAVGRLVKQANRVLFAMGVFPS